jgi:uncharacterized protein (UPF0332 family)
MEDVMPELEFARQTLLFVQALLDIEVGHPWFYRMMVGRLYYAAHHLGRLLLQREGLQPNQWRVNVHRQVIEELRQRFVAHGRMSDEAFRALAELQRLRRIADYDLSMRIRRRMVTRALELYNTFLLECQQILGVI